MTPPAAVPSTGPRERLVRAARELTIEHGWSAVTMSKVAARAGVSRQTVYDVLRDRAGVGEAMIEAELGAFLSRVTTAFDDEADLRRAVTHAVTAVLTEATSNQLLQTIITQGLAGGDQLLPKLTTDSDLVLGAAVAVVSECLRPFSPGTGANDLEAVADIVVRTVLSYVMSGTEQPHLVARRIADAAVVLLRTEST